MCIAVVGPSVVAAPDSGGLASGRSGPAETVTAVYQDHAGFLWVGTRESLFLFDGYGFRAFEHDVNDPASISDNDIRTIYEDRDRRLWIATNTGGLNRIDRGSWTFEHYRHDSTDPTTISHDSVYGMAHARDGSFWVGTQIGLNRLDPETGRFERFLHDPDDDGSLAHDYVFEVFEDSRGDLWVGTVGGGLDVRRGGSDAFEHFVPKDDDETSIPGDQVFGILEDPSGRMWIGTNLGLARMTDDRTAFERIPLPLEEREILVTSLAFSAPSSLWLGTFGDGVLEVDTETLEVRVHRATDVPGDEERIVTVETDGFGTVWIGTWDRGLRKIGTSAGRFQTIDDRADRGGLSFRETTTVAEGADGRLWIGTWANGLNRIDTGERRARSYDELSDELRLSTVLATFEDHDAAVWCGTMSALVRLEPATDAYRAWKHDDGTGLGPGYVTAITRTRDGMLWVGVGGSGLHRMREDGSFERYMHRGDDPTSLSDDYITTLFEDSSDTLWIGTRSGGLNAMDRARGTFRRFVPAREEPASLSHHYVTDVVEDDGGLWVATSGGGLNRLVLDAGGDGVFDRYTERDGLLDDNVMALAIDDDGSVWAGSKRGLSRFDPDTGRFFNLGTDQGLPAAVFHPGGSEAGDDALYFATRRGVVRIPRGTPFPAPRPSPTRITDIRTPDGAVAATRPAWELENIELPWREVLSIEFSVLDFGETDRHRYMYRMAGLREDWIDLGSRREITFTDLAPKTYRLEVRGRNIRGQWSATDHPLEIRIVPPFWMTNWFRFAVLGAIGFAVLAGHRVRTASLERRNRELVALKEQRERALDEARRSETALQDAYRRLRRLTRRLEAAKEDERKRIARELHDEMGQALTAAKINLQLLAGSPDERDRAKRIDEAVDLVDRLIGHVRALSLDLRPPLLDELGLLAAVRGYLESVAQRSGLDVDVRHDPSLPPLPPEIEIAVFRVVQEATTNILRHAEAGQVRVVMHRDGANGEDASHGAHADAPDEANGHALRIEIRDDGRGFDVDRTLARAAGGHHLGLLGIRERVEGLGGEVELDSAPGRGTTVRVRLPWAPLAGEERT